MQVLIEKLVRPECGQRGQEDENAEEHVAGWIAEITGEVPIHDGKRGPLCFGKQYHNRQQNQQKDDVIK